MARAHGSDPDGRRDVPGLNSVIKSVTYRATELGFDVYGIRRGWEGLTHQRPGSEPDSTYVVHLDRNSTRGDRSHRWDLAAHLADEPAQGEAQPPPGASGRPGGLDDQRRRIFDLTPIVLDNIESMGLDYLVPIGGDDTLSFAQTLHENGVPLIAIPKTMDNDVQGTEYCIGFSTADHPCQGAHQPAAHDARLARAHRLLPHLRA